MLDPLLAILAAVLTALLAAGAALGRALTPPAAVVAGAFAITIVLFAGFGFLGVLIAFVVASSLATRYRFTEKRTRHVQEGRAGERGISNVLAHIVLPTALAVANGLGWISSVDTAVLFAAALSFGLADTFASEFGVLSSPVWSILSFRRVEPGTNGGISAVGEVFALGGAVGIAAVGALAYVLARTPLGPLSTFLVIVGLAGFVACQVDSILGAGLENRGWLTKGTTNFLGMLSAIAIAGAILAWLGPTA